MIRRSTLAFSCALAVIATTGLLNAGPLSPPGGPVAPTGKTTQEVFDKVAAVEPRIAVNATNTPGDNDSSPSVFKITQPGSYYLTGNIAGEFGKHGIEIAASRVTLDLNGFSVEGVNGALDGIRTTGPQFNITVRNGSVRVFQDGVDLADGGPGGSCIIEGVFASANAGVGIRTGANCTLRQCGSSGNVQGGFVVGETSIVESCTASTINLGPGFQAESGCAFSNCISSRNGGHGFVVVGGSTLRGCVAYANAGEGISATVSGTMTDCVTRNNLSSGIVAAGWRVDRCTASGNTLDGIRITGSGAVLGCLSEGNGPGGDIGAGIRVTGTDVRVEGNTCNTNDRGVQVDGAGNMIIRNSCSGNQTDWVIAANNIVGPIIDRRNPSSTAINGFSAPSSLGSTDVNANYSH